MVSGGTFREWFCTVYADAINTDGRWREIEHRWNVLERFLHFCYLGTQCLIPGSLYRAKHTMPSHLPNCSNCTLRNYSLLTSKLDWQLNTRICMHEPSYDVSSSCITNGNWLTGFWMYFAIQGKGNESLAEAVVLQFTPLSLLWALALSHARTRAHARRIAWLASIILHRCDNTQTKLRNNL